MPLIVRWPGKVPAGSTSDELASNVDFLATLAALVGQDQLARRARDSYNMLPAITGEPEAPIRDHLIIAANSPRHLSIRKGPWMYIPAQGGGGFRASEVGAHTFGGPAAIAFADQENSDIVDGKLCFGHANPDRIEHPNTVNVTMQHRKKISRKRPVLPLVLKGASAFSDHAEQLPVNP